VVNCSLLAKLTYMYTLTESMQPLSGIIKTVSETTEMFIRPTTMLVNSSAQRIFIVLV